VVEQAIDDFVGLPDQHIDASTKGGRRLRHNKALETWSSSL
jgi:hypothetical protein